MGKSRISQNLRDFSLRGSFLRYIRDVDGKHWQTIASCSGERWGAGGEHWDADGEHWDAGELVLRVPLGNLD